MIDGKISRSQFDLEQVLTPGKVQRAGLGCEALALFEDVSNVIAAEGLELEGIFDGTGHFVGAINLAQCDDLGDVESRAQAALLELAMILFGTRTESIKAQEQFGIPGCAAPLKKFLDVVRVFEMEKEPD